MINSLYSKQELIADKLTEEVAHDLARKHNIVFCGMGGSVHKDVEKIGVSFNCYRQLSITEARQLLISCADDYLQKINHSLELRPYLHVYPFTVNELELRIFISDDNESKKNLGDLVAVSVVYGNVRYKKWKTEYTMETVLEESFEEAARIVREGK